ncbi:MAG TPA: GNAT family N-acetyltransferase [Chloroflexi bacterium]|nr:GNAT family N-acetyltransferase [Chloroflexota bacterium]
MVANWFRSHIENGVDYYAASEAGGRILGISVVKIDPILGFELLGLVVRSEHHRQGIGRKLVENAVGLAQQSGFSAIYTAVFADNKAMLRLLIGLDFIPVRMTHRVRADGADIMYLKKYFTLYRNVLK